MKNLVVFCAAGLMLAAASSSSWAVAPKQAKTTLQEVASSSKQWTGVAVSKDGRIFVNYPRWSDDVPVSVGELKDGNVVPYPDAELNSWKAGESPINKFVCVQAVFVDEQNRLWIVDPAAPKMKAIIKGGPKLIQVDLATNKVVRVYAISENIAPEKSYLNDVRIDLKNNTAFLTDSGTGAIIAVDLASGTARRLLADHPSTKAENIEIAVNGKKWLRNGLQPKINSDGIAIDPSQEFLWYHALTGKTLYRVPIASLIDTRLTNQALGAKVQRVGTTVPCDGMEFGHDGKLYLSSIEDNSIKQWNGAGAKGSLQKILTDRRLDWPDSFAVGSDGSVFVTASRINEGDKPTQPYGLYKFKP